jgi:hypothetical protein
MVKVCVPSYSILGHRRVFSHCPLEKHPHSSLREWLHPSLREWLHPSLRGYSSMSLEYPKLNTWTEANLGKFLIPLLYEGLFLLYEGLFSFPSLWRSTCGISLSFFTKVLSLSPSLQRSSYGIKKISCGSKYFHGIIPCYPSAGHHPYIG